MAKHIIVLLIKITHKLEKVFDLSNICSNYSTKMHSRLFCTRNKKVYLIHCNIRLVLEQVNFYIFTRFFGEVYFQRTLFFTIFYL